MKLTLDIRHLTLWTAVVFSFWTASVPVNAATIDVTTTAETSTTDCTLGDAISTALTETSTGQCTWSGHRSVRLVQGEVYVVSAAWPSIDGPLSISGAFSVENPARIERASGASGRFFTVLSTGRLYLTNLALAGGNDTSGGAVRVNSGGRLDLFGVTLEGNSATSDYGGAIYNQGDLTATKSTFAGNDAVIFGGAVYNVGSGTVDARNSTWRDNTAFCGGALYQQGGAVDLETSTFSANSAYYGGAIYSKSGNTTVDYSTFRNNDGSSGLAGTLFMEWGSLTAKRSVWTAASTLASLCHGSQYVTHGAANVWSDGTCGAPPSEVVGAEIEMSELIYHGGHTRVHVPLCDWSSGSCESPVLDQLSGTDCPEDLSLRDQRDQFPRRKTVSPGANGGDLCDFGSYESVCESYTADAQSVMVTLHEYQLPSGGTTLLDNGACYGHPLFEEGGTDCSITWTNHGVRLELLDVIFLTPTCSYDCFTDPDLCALHCADADPTGWTGTANSNGTFTFHAPTCTIPEQTSRYVLHMRDIATGTEFFWDPRTPIDVDT